MFRNKQNEDGVVVKNKVRLVAQGWLPLRDSGFIIIQATCLASSSMVFDHVLEHEGLMFAALSYKGGEKEMKDKSKIERESSVKRRVSWLPFFSRGRRGPCCLLYCWGAGLHSETGKNLHA